MKDLQHNQFAYSNTAELRNFHVRTALRKFSTFTELRKMFGTAGLRIFSRFSELRKFLMILDLEIFQQFLVGLDLENFSQLWT